jgi:exodeoxyribonuclease VII large subunit
MQSWRWRSSSCLSDPEKAIMPSANVLTVSQITAHIKSLFASDRDLSDVWLSGEVSNFKLHTSGHCYLTLKDATSSIKAVIWRTTASRIVLPRDGDAVIAHGYVSVYEAQGAYQFYIDQLEAAGAGRLWMEFERLKQRLAAEGVFDLAAKRPVPPMPRRLGIVTSSTAAALRDILRTLASRYPLVDVLLAPTLVQGESAPPRIVAAIEALNRWSAEREALDAILLARGGGSIEELWAFNDERVAKAIRASSLPVITGIGHETDFTIADFAADLRAPTPTGAATLAVPEARELRETIAGFLAAGSTQLRGRLDAAAMQMDSSTARLDRLSPSVRLASDRQKVDDLARRAQLAAANRLHSQRQQLAGLQLHLRGLDPSGVLARGYAIVSTPGNAVISSTTQVAPGNPIKVRVADGTFGAQVTDDR